MAEYTLHGFAQSGNCYKVALALELAGADWAPRFVDYFGGETRTPAYREINAMGEAPVLEHRVMAEFGKRAETAWGILDAHLAGRSFVVDDRLTVADLSLCGDLYWPDEIGVDWANCPNSAQWLARIAATPRWRTPYELLPGHPRPAA